MSVVNFSFQDFCGPIHSIGSEVHRRVVQMRYEVKGGLLKSRFGHGAQPMASHFGVDEHPFATYFDVHLGFPEF